MGKKLAIEHHLIRPKEVIELLEMMGGKNTDNANGYSFLYYTLCTPKINNPNNEKIICGFTNLKMQNDFFAIFTLEKFWKKYPYKLNELVLCDDGLLGVITKMEWDCKKCDMKYHVSFNISDYNKWYSSKNIKCKFMAAKNKKLAIKGHPTRGKEVIELLEMMGGINCYNLYGDENYACYIIENGEIKGCEYIFGDEPYAIYALAEFYKKYPFKVGDVIKFPNNMAEEIAEMKWDEELEDIIYTSVSGWTRPSFVPKNTNNKTKIESTGFMQLGKTVAVIFNDANYEDEVELQLGDYEIVVRDGKIYAVRKKPVYPKTYEECCKIMYGISRERHLQYDTIPSYKFEEDLRDLLEILRKLIICRKAYWKIAGEKMGLGKSWEHDYLKDANTIRYTIYNTGDEIVKLNEKLYRNYTLCFPTEEMRDAFYENFKDLIEQCKEFL